MLGRPQTVTDQQIGLALRQSGGVMTHAADELGITRQQLGKRIRGNAELEQARADGKEEVLDRAESNLFQAVRAGRPWAIRFVLSRIGKDRGYGPSLKVDGALQGRVVVYLPDDGREQAEEPEESENGNVPTPGD